MSHQHIQTDDIRRFVRLATDQDRFVTAAWFSDFSAAVRYCDECTARARQACALLLPLSYENTDPLAVTEDCLSIDDLMDLDRRGESAEAQHLQHCARCQFLYQEALALSDLGAEKDGHDVAETVTPGGAEHLLVLLRATLQIAAGYAAFVLIPGVMRGVLLGVEDAPLESTAEITAGTLQHASLEVNDDEQTLTVRNLPESCGGARLRLRVGPQVLAPSRIHHRPNVIGSLLERRHL